MSLMVSQVGQVANTVLASQREYAHKMDAVSVAMDKLRLPAQLRARVEQYYAYLWSRHGTFDIRHQLADELSSCLRSEMNIFFHRRLIAKAPLFADCSSEVIQAVVAQLVPAVFLQGDFVVRAGMPMTAMHFIAAGRCSILVDDRERVSVLLRIRTLRRTQYTRPPEPEHLPFPRRAPSIYTAGTSASSRSSARKSRARRCTCSPRRTSTCTCCTARPSTRSSASSPSCSKARS